MKYTLHTSCFDPGKYPESPQVEPGKEFVKLNVSKLSYVNGKVTFKFHVSYMLPKAVVQRYQSVGEAFVLVLNDVDQQDCFSVRMSNDFIRYPRDVRHGPNLIGEPPISLEPKTYPAKDGFGGGWINGEISFESPGPRHSPGIFTYVILENYISNVVGFDLIKNKVINF